nr:glycoside hydrolase family 32 protein [uncultured Carboxylicivirga sp.]
MNDPNGLVYLNGQYHLFYQHYPYDIVWGPMHWGHASSTDLFHWEHHPIALYPDSLGNIFSGSAVIDHNNTAGFGKDAMVAIFTYHNDSIWAKGFKNTESQGIAFSMDEGITWTKYKSNPILNNNGEQDFRDPKVFWNRETELWQMVLAVGDHIRIFSSPNLLDWKFESNFKPNETSEPLGVWECPDLFPLKYNGNTKWVMIINHGDKGPNGGSCTRYFIGDFDGNTFQQAQDARWLDYGTDFYAGVTFSNVPDDKKYLISWMSNWKYANQTPTKVWRSAMTIPRELVLDMDSSGYFIRQHITEGLHALKSNTIVQEQISSNYHLSNIDLSQALISFRSISELLKIKIGNSSEHIIIEINDDSVVIDRSNSGVVDFSDRFATKVQSMPISEAITECKIILDRSSIELLLNDGKYSMTNIFFPNEKYSELSITGEKDSKITHLKIDHIARIWP